MPPATRSTGWRGQAGARRFPGAAQRRPGRRRRVRQRAVHAGALHHRSRSLPPAGRRRCRSAWRGRAPPSAMRSGSASTCSTRTPCQAKTMIALTDGNDTGSQVPPAEAARVAQGQGHHHPYGRGWRSRRGRRGQARRGGAEGRRATSPAAVSIARSTAPQLADIYRQLDAIETRKVDTVSFQPRTELFWLPLLALAVLVDAGAGAHGGAPAACHAEGVGMSAFLENVPSAAALGAACC